MRIQLLSATAHPELEKTNTDNMLWDQVAAVGFHLVHKCLKFVQLILRKSVSVVGSYLKAFYRKQIMLVTQPEF